VIRRRITLALALLFIALAVEARIGGGQTYSGSSSSPSSAPPPRSSPPPSHDYDSHHDYTPQRDVPSPSSSTSSSSIKSGGSSGDSDPATAIFLALCAVVFIVGSAIIKERNAEVPIEEDQPAPTRMIRRPAAPSANLSDLRKFDPNFSEIVFTDFCYSLFARLYEALGRGELDHYAPYVAQHVRDTMRTYIGKDTRSIDEVVIGSFAVVAVRGLETPNVSVDVEFEANYTETSAATQRWYVKERWTLTRTRDLLSPPPENAKADHCPKCGAPLETRTDGACLHCGSIISDGSFQWFVRAIQIVSKDPRPRDLGGSGAEVGTNNVTLLQPGVTPARAAFEQAHPDFTWAAFDERVRQVATELQAAWSSRDWERARAFETGPLFQMHRYWIDEYIRQGLRNVVDDFTITAVVVAKLTSDAFFDAIVVRIYAAGRDYTIDEPGVVVGGSQETIRKWSEYWTFIRGRAGVSADARICPNCGGRRKEGQTVICEYCGGQFVSGDFPWVLSRIEQDEAYRG